jgi:hypothetical protein
MEDILMNEQFPQWWAYAITVMLFLLLAAGSWLIPEKEILSDAPDRARWRDLRWWATALITIQLLIYYLFS